MTAHNSSDTALKFARRAVLVPIAAMLVVFGTAACAPEAVAGSVDKEAETTSPETKWGSDDTAGTELTATLPESFPSDVFKLPTEATIYNAGERNSEQWFVVLKTADTATGEALWSSIIELNAFAVADETDTSEGGVAATLTQGPLTVQAMSIPNADGSVLLSYDVSRMF